MPAYKQENFDAARRGDVRDCRTEINYDEPELRMWLLVRKDIPMPIGKFAAQAGHGYATCLWLMSQKDPVLASDYIAQAQSKVAVYVKSEMELLNCIEECKAAGLVATTVTDAARTHFSEPTVTVGAVGPCYRDQLPKKVQRLRLFEGWVNTDV